MRVNIGPYINNFRVYQWEDRWLERRYGEKSYNIKKRDYDWQDRLVIRVLDSVQWVLDQTVNRIQRRRKRKIQVRIDRHDTWSADHTLAYVILPVLQALKDRKQGSPVVDDADVPGELQSTSAPVLTVDQQNTGGVDDLYFQRWDWVLDQMIFAFKSKLDDDWEDQFTSGEHDHVMVPINEAGELVDEADADWFRMENGPNNTYQMDHAGRAAYQARITNGFRLFGKYYEALWC